MFLQRPRVGRALWAALLVIAFGVGSVQARPALPRDMDGNDFAWFYNKPGVTLQQYRDDEAFCATPGRPPADQAVYGRGGLVTGVIGAAMAPGRESALRDNCMIARGYRRFDIRPGNQRTFLEHFAQGGDEDLASYVSSSDPPVGVLAEQWGNEFMDAQTSVYAQEVLDMPAATQAIARAEAAGINFYYLRGRAAPELAAGDTVNPGMATVVLAMTTPDGERVAFNRDILAFLKIDPDTGNVPLSNGHPTFINLGQWNREREPQRFQVFQVPPGRYAFWRFVDTENKTVDFCLRTVGFDVRAGEVVYAGRWQVAAGHPLNISMADSEEARTAVRQISPEVGDAMQLATYRNGVRLPCPTYYLPEYFFYYGIDLPVHAQ